MERLAALNPRTFVRDLPQFAFDQLRRLLDSVDDVAVAQPLNPPQTVPHPGTACEPVEAPFRELLLLLVRGDLATLINRLGGRNDGTVLPLSFWRALPNGALEGVKDAYWIAQTVVGFSKCATRGKQELRPVLKEIRRVALATTASQAYLAAVVSLIHED
ncbi:hypothetical protein H9P43_007122 [Blastocladiella emersonii ATCC 22665]|nr:hypothetical protein H9P43_007122 [Blastocladiella emersonii ATCC 22665]